MSCADIMQSPSHTTEVGSAWAIKGLCTQPEHTTQSPPTPGITALLIGYFQDSDYSLTEACSILICSTLIALLFLSHLSNLGLVSPVMSVLYLLAQHHVSRVGGWLAHNGCSVPASLPTECSLYSPLAHTEHSWIALTGYHPPPHSAASVGNTTRIASDRKWGGKNPDNRLNS